MEENKFLEKLDLEIREAFGTGGGLPANFSLDDTFVNFGKGLSRWVVGGQIKKSGGETACIATFGSFSMKDNMVGEHRVVCSWEKYKETSGQKKLREDFIYESMKKRQKKKEEKLKSFIKKHEGFQHLPKLVKHDYFVQKRIDETFEDVKTDGDGNCLIPMQQVDGTVSGIQVIAAKAGDDGKHLKKFKYGSVFQGSFYCFGDWRGESEAIYLAEGFAKSWLVHKATAKPVMCCFAANNYINVIKKIKLVNPSCKIIIAGDNDEHMKLQDKICASEHHCEKIKEAYGDRVCVVKPDEIGTDWNDYYESVDLNIDEVFKKLTSWVDSSKDVVALGVGRDGSGYYIMSTENPYKISHKKLDAYSFLETMPDESWWADRFGYYDKSGNPKVNWKTAMTHYVKECIAKREFKTAKLRKEGVFYHEGELIVNSNSKVWVSGKGFVAARRYKDLYFCGASDFPIPLSKGKISNDKITDFRKYFKACCWKDDYLGEKFMLGQFAAMTISAALPYRPHGWISGEPDCGKSDLFKTITSSLVNTGLATCAVATSSEAGVRREIGTCPRGLILDEFESLASKNDEASQKILTLFRVASTADFNSTIKMADGSDGVVEYTPMFSGLVCSVRVSLSLASDWGRFCRLHLEKKKIDANQAKGYNEAKKKVSWKDIGVHVYSVCCNNIDRIYELYESYLEQYRPMFDTAHQYKTYAILSACYEVVSGEAIDLSRIAEDKGAILDRHRGMSGSSFNDQVCSSNGKLYYNDCD